MYIITNNDWSLASYSNTEIGAEWKKTHNINISENDILKLKQWCILSELWKIIETAEYNNFLNNKAEEQIKADKRASILAIASETDQINLMASVLDTLTSEAPDVELIAKAKDTFNEIKIILNK